MSSFDERESFPFPGRVMPPAVGLAKWERVEKTWAAAAPILDPKARQGKGVRDLGNCVFLAMLPFSHPPPESPTEALLSPPAS